MESQAIGEYMRSRSGHIYGRRSARVRRHATLCVAGLIALMLAGSLLAGAGPALAATSPMSWASPFEADDQPPFASGTDITGVSCPTTGLCVAVDSLGDVLSSIDPTGGTGAWVRAANVAGGFRGVSCPSAELCVGISGRDVITSTDPTGGAGAWNATEVFVRGSEHGLEAVSCASVTLCVATDDRGDVVTSTDPTGGASAWTETNVDSPYGLGDVSCPSVRLCVAVAPEGDLVTSTDPAGGAGAWTETNVDGTGEDRQLLDVSCSSETLCVAIDNRGDVLTSTDPTGGMSAWTSAHVGTGIDHISCVTGLCVATADEDSANVITSTNPTGGASAWTSTSIELGTESLEAVSCPAAGLCVLVDSESGVITSTEPTGGASAWTVTHVEVGGSDITGVSCVSVEFCVAVDDAGKVLTSTDPQAGPGTWSSVSVDGNGLDAVSCPSAGFCVGVDDAGDVVVSADPTGGAHAWSVADVDATRRLTGVSCASARLCVAIDSEGDIVTSANPAGGAGAWSFVRLYPGLNGVSCPSEHLCVLAAEGYIVTSTEPAGGADTWSLKYVNAEGKISCPSVSLCVAVNSGGLSTGEVSFGDPMSAASRWPKAYVEGVNGLNEVSCAQGGGLCLVSTDGGGNGSWGNVISSTDPAGGTGAWIESNVYNEPLRPPKIDLPLGGAELPAISCVPEGMCVAAERGSVMVGTAVPAAPANTAAPVLSGTPSVGQTLSCSQGAWTGFPSPTFTYQWLREGTPISGSASASTYVVQDADQGHGLACQVTAVNDLGSESATSNTLQIPAAQAPSGGGSGGGDSPGGGSPGAGTPLTGGSSGGSGSVAGSGGGSAGTLARTASNALVLNGIESVAARGTVKLTLTLPGPGTLQIVGKASAAQLAAVSRTKKKHETTLVIARLRLTVSKAGRIVVTLAPTAGARAVLARRGKLRATVTFTYTPNGGASRSIVRTVTFRLKRRR
jgi:hypothetical protein